LLSHQALRIAEKENPASALIGLLRDPSESQAMGARARQVFDQQAGATDRCVVAIQELLSDSARIEGYGL
jgi:3-deoxy-D-manno-octulosonic-acid transferase